MNLHCNSYKIPRVCLLLIGMGVIFLIFGIGQVAHADDQSNTTTQPTRQTDCNGCFAVGVSLDSDSQSLIPDLDDPCDICHAGTQEDNKEDALYQRNTEERLYVTLMSIVAFKHDNAYFAKDERIDSIVEHLNSARQSLDEGDVDGALELIEDANSLLDSLHIEAQRTTLIDGTVLVYATFVAVQQSESKFRSINETFLKGQFSLLLDTDNQAFIVAMKQHMGFIVRTEQVLHRRVPLSDEEGNVLNNYACFKSRLPSLDHVQSLFCSAGRLRQDGF